jgi:hypothetical protein
VPGAQEILARVITGAGEIPDRFISGCGWGDLGQQACTQELGQLARIAPIRLDVIARLPRDQRRCYHLAAQTRARQLPL